MKKLIIIILIILFSLFTLFNNTIERFVPRLGSIRLSSLKPDINKLKKAASKLGPPKNVNVQLAKFKGPPSRLSLKDRLAKIRAEKPGAPDKILPRQKGASKLEAQKNARIKADTTRDVDLRNTKKIPVKPAPNKKANSVSVEQGSAEKLGGMGKKPKAKGRTSRSGGEYEKSMKNLGIEEANKFAKTDPDIESYLDEIKAVDGELARKRLLDSIIKGENVRKNVKKYNNLPGSQGSKILLKKPGTNQSYDISDFIARARGIEKNLSRKITLETKLKTLKILKRKKFGLIRIKKVDEVGKKLNFPEIFNQKKLTPFEKVKELKKIEVEKSKIDPKNFQETEEIVQLGDLPDSLDMKLDEFVDMEFTTSLKKTDPMDKQDFYRFDIVTSKKAQENIKELSDAVKKSDLSPKIKPPILKKLEDKLKSARLNIKNREALKAQKLKDMTEKATIIQRFLRATRIRPQKNIDVLTDLDVKTTAKSIKNNKTDSIVDLDTKGKNATKVKEIEEVKKSVDSIIKPNMKNKKWIAPLVILSMAGVAGATAIAIVLSEQNEEEASYNETLEDMKGSGIDINDNTNTANLSGVVNSENLNSDGTIKDPNEELKKIQKELDQIGKSTINDQINEAFDDIASLFGLPKSGNIFKWATLGILILIILLLFYFMLFSGSNSEEEEYIEDDYYIY